MMMLSIIIQFYNLFNSKNVFYFFQRKKQQQKNSVTFFFFFPNSIWSILELLYSSFNFNFFFIQLFFFLIDIHMIKSDLFYVAYKPPNQTLLQTFDFSSLFWFVLICFSFKKEHYLGHSMGVSLLQWIYCLIRIAISHLYAPNHLFRRQNSIFKV